MRGVQQEQLLSHLFEWKPPEPVLDAPPGNDERLTRPGLKGIQNAFWVSYESAVHHNDALSDVDKFNYLRSLVEQSAYDALTGLTLSAANYQEAVETLTRRFGNRQLIITRHMGILLNLSAVSVDNDLRGLRQLYNSREYNFV